MKHIVACAYPGSGHLLPLMGFLLDIVSRDSTIIVTLITYRPLVKLALQERARLSTIPEGNFRILGVSDTEPPKGIKGLIVASSEFNAAGPPAYQVVASRGTVQCVVTGTVYDYKDVPSPSVAFCDCLTPEMGRTFKSVTPKIKLIGFWTSTASWFTRWCGPKQLGGLGSWEADAKALTDLPLVEAVKKVECGFEGVRWPNPEGVEMFDHELFAQDISHGEIWKLYFDGINQTLTVVDGVALATTESFEPKTAVAIHNWFPGGKAWFVGPNMATRLLASGGVRQPPKTELFAFLDSQAANSVWLISFGTIFYPFMHPSQLSVVLATLLDLDRPVIFSRAAVMSTLAPLPEDLEARLREKGNVLVLEDFFPQVEVLRHPSVGAFLTHGGANSMFELIAASGSGVMPVFWPLLSDQPIHAAYLAVTRDCAFELKQIRVGPGAKPPMRGGTIEGTEEAISTEIRDIVRDMLGAVGNRKRKNLEVVRDELVASLRSGGSVDQQTGDILDYAFD